MAPLRIAGAHATSVGGSARPGSRRQPRRRLGIRVAGLGPAAVRARWAAGAAGAAGRPSHHPPTMIFIGDLSTSMRALAVDDLSTGMAIGELLGLVPAGGPNAPSDVRSDAPGGLLVRTPPDLGEAARPGVPGGRSQAETTVPPRVADTASLPAEPADWLTVPAADERTELPAWLDATALDLVRPSTGELPAAAATPPTGTTGATGDPAQARRMVRTGGPVTRLASPPTFPGLFRDSVARAIISTSLAVRAAEGDVDVDAVTRLLALGEPLVNLPRRRVPTSRLGVQVLLDFGDAMMPYLRDLTGLPGLLTSVLGAAVDVLRFELCPVRGVGRDDFPDDPYTPPPRAGTPVLVVTDLGGGGPLAPPAATAAQWAAFVDIVRQARCRPVALVPGPAGTAAPHLAAVLPILPWDASTTVHEARLVCR